MPLTEFKTFKKTSNRLFVYDHKSEKLLVKCYYAQPAEKRRDKELFIMRYWHNAGYRVPEIHDIKIPSIDVPYIVMNFIDGISLQHFLSTDDNSLETKLETLSRFFKNINGRHDRAIRNNEGNLIHFDPSTGNVICADNDFLFIDFEDARKKRSVLNAAAIETATLCKWIVRDMGIRYADNVLSCLVSVYGNRKLLNLIVKQTAGVPFQFFHRRRDRNKKLANPREVTKYDIADALAKLL
ncbi:MAG: hypothetical protein KAR13_20775 [Desulfobulbaceae bacterium]|nr:hypothetical protein [Desulfobulbaceae bacterium]